MNVFGGSRRVAKGPRGLRGFPGKDALELCNYLPNTISRCLRENDQIGSFVLTSPEDCDIVSGFVQKWKSKRIGIPPQEHFKAEKASKLSKIKDKEKYALNFPGVYRNNYLDIFTTLRAYGYICITFRTNSDVAQTILHNAQGSERGHLYHEITVTGTDVSIHGRRDKKIAVERIPCDTKKWTTLYLEWSLVGHSPLYNANITYIINNDPNRQGSFHLEQSVMSFPGYVLGDRGAGYESQPFSGQVHALENYLSDHPIPVLFKNLVITKQMITM